MFALPNLVSTVVEPCKPWEWTLRDHIPPRAFADKTARDAWASSPATLHQMYSGFEGLNSSLRVSENNPPVYLWMLAIDYDVAMSEAEMDMAIARLPLKPNWVERTLSGNWRLIWLLERPIPLASITFTGHLLKNLHTLIPLGALGGLDRPAVETFSRYYTNSGVWRKIHDKPIPWDTIEGWLVRVSSQFKWVDGIQGPEIDLKIVLPRLTERYPRIAEWPGEFVVGSQGPSFFVEGSVSPKSAIVNKKGIFTFSAHSTKPYYTWADLCGADWVQAFEQNKIGAAVKDIYFDDKNFFVFNPVTETWMPESKEHIQNELLVARGLNKNTARGDRFSEVEEAVNYIRHHHRVAGAASFAFLPKGVMKWNGNTYLNLHTREVMKPGPSGIWGVDFPWLSEYFENLFTDPEALPYYLSWLARFYQGCYRRNPLMGQGVFLFGPPNTGKTLLNRMILSPLMGGHAECKEWMLGSTNFNSELFESAVWVMDDATPGTSAQAHRYFSEMAKVVTANPDMRSTAKFGKPSQVAGARRLSVTANNDPESRRIMPRVDISILEKLMIFCIANRTKPFPTGDELKKILAKELPAFAKFLLDYQTPQQCLSDDPRFGVKSYHDKSIMAMAIASGDGFDEVIDHWMVEHFTTRKPMDDYWEGTALQLRQAILQDPSMTDTMKAFDLDDIKRRLMKLASGTSLPRVELVQTDQKRIKFRIYRGEDCPRKPTTAAAISAKNGSKFEKK